MNLAPDCNPPSAVSDCTENSQSECHDEYEHEKQGDTFDISAANDLDAAHWRFNAPAPTFQDAVDKDETCDQTAVALATNFTGEAACLDCVSVAAVCPAC